MKGFLLKKLPVKAVYWFYIGEWQKSVQLYLYKSYVIEVHTYLYKKPKLILGYSAKEYKKFGTYRSLIRLAI